MADQQQSLKSHARLDPLFHQFLIPVALLLLIGTVYSCVINFSWMTALNVLAVVWAIVAMFKIRLYALKVQDRVIRLEERVRLEKLCSEGFKPKIHELTEDQLIGLRFADDGEVVKLAEKALAEHWDRKQIKLHIENWRPDDWRV